MVPRSVDGRPRRRDDAGTTRRGARRYVGVTKRGTWTVRVGNRLGGEGPTTLGPLGTIFQRLGPPTRPERRTASQWGARNFLRREINRSRGFGRRAVNSKSAPNRSNHPRGRCYVGRSFSISEPEWTDERNAECRRVERREVSRRSHEAHPNALSSSGRGTRARMRARD